MESPERKFLHDVMLDRFKRFLKPHDVIYDIGKSVSWDYKPRFPEQKLYTIDRTAGIGADFVINIEQAHADSIAPADALLCNGVTEQCDNMLFLFRGMYDILKKGGYVLFGMCSVGYPIYCQDGFNDKVRLTPQGAQWLVTRQFAIIEMETLKRGDLPSYIYIIGRK